MRFDSSSAGSIDFIAVLNGRSWTKQPQGYVWAGPVLGNAVGEGTLSAMAMFRQLILHCRVAMRKEQNRFSQSL